ncbi:MAG TPA: hypothetical protein DEB06_09040 [Phycisphaerales bacterium]|nr:hypothetical protein [Phycisphaerales bacterium]
MKRSMIAVGVVGVAVLCALATLSRAGQSEGVRSIDSLAFFAGHWVGEGLGGAIEEGWFPPKHGTMTGIFRLTNEKNGLMVMEPMLIEQEGERVSFRFRHFGKAMKAWEPNDKPLTFALAEVGPSRAVFDAPDRAQKPARLVYTVENDRLRVDIVSLKPDGSQDEAMTVEYDRFKR